MSCLHRPGPLLLLLGVMHRGSSQIMNDRSEHADVHPESSVCMLVSTCANLAMVHRVTINDGSLLDHPRPSPSMPAAPSTLCDLLPHAWSKPRALWAPLS